MIGTYRANSFAHRRRVVGNQAPAVARAVAAGAPDIHRIERLIGLADVDDQGTGVEDLVRDLVEDQGIADTEIVDVVLDGGGGGRDGGLLIGGGGAGLEFDGGFQGDADEIGIEGGAGGRVGGVVVERLLDRGEERGRSLGSDGVDVAGVGT